jgi:hypothetical protein
VSVSVGLGPPAPMSSSDNSSLSACASTIAQEQSSADRSVAIPVSVTMTVLSSLAADVTVNVDSFGFVTSGGSGNVDENGEQSLSGVPLWAEDYSNGPTCQTWNDLGAGSVHWSSTAATPNSTQSWSAWLILPNAISPNDPTGNDVAQRLVLQPAVSIAGSPTYNVKPNQASSSIVMCYSQSDLIPGNAPFLAELPSTAIADGCTQAQSQSSTATTSSGHSSVSADAICNARYPGGQSRTIHVSGGTNTIYNRQSSLEQVCTGFGYPEGLQVTPGMSCALIAAIATYAGPGADQGTDNLCTLSSVAEGYSSDRWLGAASSAGSDKACGFLSDVFATGTGVTAAGLSSETGPGAVAVGVGTYKAFSAGLKLACGFTLGGEGSALGTKLEADNETHIMLAVLHNNECMLFSQKRGISGSSWHSTTCP